MRCSLYTLYLFLFSVLTLTGQSQLEYGLKAGVRAGQVDLVSSIDFPDSKPQFNTGHTSLTPQFGFWLSVPLSRRWHLQPELLWLPKHYEDQVVPDSLRNPINFTYFSLPVALGYQAGKWRITAGPELSFLLDQHYTRPDRSPGQHENNLIEEHTFELGINLGVQYQHRRLVAGLRANRNVTDFLNFDLIFRSGEEFIRLYHQGLTLWLGYRL